MTIRPTIERYHVVDKDGVWLERDADRMNKSDTISDILSGQFNSIGIVYCSATADGTIRDVSEDMALDVLRAAFHDQQEVVGAARDFVENQLGCEILATHEREVRQDAGADERHAHSFGRPS